MEYYDPIDHTSRRYAAVVTVVLMSLLALLASVIRVEVHPTERLVPPLEILFESVDEVEEPQPEVVQSAPTDVRRDRAPAHVETATRESSVQTSGDAEKTQTLNPAALFKPTVGNSAERVSAGNRLAPDGDEESNRGEGAGFNLQGTDQLDAGLQGRGLREGLPKPSTTFNSAGKVVVYVTVDSDGNVTSAEVRQTGTTTQDPTLRKLALEAARKAKFRPSSRTTQGGTITYVFTLQ